MEKNSIAHVKGDNIDRSMNIIDKLYWKNAIKKYLSSEDTILAQNNDCTLEEEYIESFNTSYRFYITGLNRNTPNLSEIKKEVRNIFSCCTLRECDEMESRPYTNPTCYILVTNEAQKFLDQKNEFNECCEKILFHPFFRNFVFFLILFLLACKFLFEYLNTYSNSW